MSPETDALELHLAKQVQEFCAVQVALGSPTLPLCVAMLRLAFAQLLKQGLTDMQIAQLITHAIELSALDARKPPTGFVPRGGGSGPAREA